MRKLIWVESAPATHFTTAIADGAIEVESLDMRDGGDIWNNQAAAKNMRNYMIDSVTFVDLDTGAPAITDWRIWFFTTANGVQGGTAVDLHEVIGILEFDVSNDARVVTGALTTKHYTDWDIKMPYFDATSQDDDTVPQLHIGLQPIGAAANMYNDEAVERIIRVGLVPVDGLP